MHRSDLTHPTPARHRRAWILLTALVVTTGAVLIVEMVSRRHPEVPGLSPVEVRHVLTKNGKATFWLTNHSRFDVIVDWIPDFEVRRSERWELLPSTNGPGQASNPVQLGPHDATSFTEVTLPELRRGMVWRLRVSVHSREGALRYWVGHPRDVLDSLQFRDPQGRFKVSIPITVFPTTTQTTTPKERVE